MCTGWAASVHKFWMLRLKIQVGSTAFEVRPWHCRIWEWPCELDSLHLACYQPSLTAKHWVWHKYQASVLLCATDRILLMLDLNPQLDKNVSVLYSNHFNCVSHWSSKHLWFYKDCECVENGPPLWLNAAQTNPLCVTTPVLQRPRTTNHMSLEEGSGELPQQTCPVPTLFCGHLFWPLAEPGCWARWSSGLKQGNQFLFVCLFVCGYLFFIFWLLWICLLL